MFQMCVMFEGLPLNSPELAGLMISAVGFAFLETIKSKTISNAVHWDVKVSAYVERR